jgi:hypothetical protein
MPTQGLLFRHRKLAFKPWDDIKGQLDAHGVDRFQEVADYISKEGCPSSLRPAEQSVADIIHKELWTPCFANTSIEKLDFSSPVSFGDFSIPELSMYLLPRASRLCVLPTAVR